MFESTVVMEGRGTRTPSGWISMAASLHGAALFLIVAASLFARVETGMDPPEPSPPIDPFRPELDVALGDSPDASGSRKPDSSPKRGESSPPASPVDVQPTPSEPPDPSPNPSVEETPTFSMASASAGVMGDAVGNGVEGDGTGTGSPGHPGQPWGHLGGTSVDGPPTTSDREGDSEESSYGVEPPVLVSRVEPEYPDVDRGARLQGKVLLEALVGVTGRVESVRVLTAATPRMEASAVRAIKQWRYRPARQNGRPIGVYVTVLIRFELR